MIDFKSFHKQVGQRFWKHIHKETLIPYGKNISDRKSFLIKLCQNVEKMKYVPAPPRGYVVSHKQNLVVRFIPTLTEEDYCVYFYCIKCLEDEIAENRVVGTYGGWKLGGIIRKLERFDEASSMPDYSYNRFAWRQAWTEYQTKAYNLQRNVNYNFFIIFDIANFYDSLNLRRLEILVRETVGKTKTEIVNLLFYFLSNWGKRDLNYDGQNTGIPQDEVGDCSRILANFYLQDYDKNISNICSKQNSSYLRYADDQIIASPNEKTAKEIMFLASKGLIKLGLNLNASKAKLLNKDGFYKYWSFDIFKLLIDANNANRIQQAWTLYKDRLRNGVKFKPETVLKRILSCNLSQLPIAIKNEIFNESIQKDFLISINEYYLKRIYMFTDNPKKSMFLQHLNKLSNDVLFNQYHLRVMKFARENKINKKYLNKVRSNLIKLNDINL
ncbi:hypothetical protein COT77_03085 [Candidatus Berkelbacteria bacterium CG10_big_fil_rev_8_21_14_0_10_41_12]|uniref:Reverse transcriptase domain-containing protein n=1 Tax=Candidatus Berkelbacteria bacterium CG10_big_fil_rev_8_21_14_0_10_41_12 TaxID=1974513 RepID=A0A2M6WWQ3_9BACT|nr:MAG: hypothetical protein COT77_03085 [Candidatus Berkelbacteria bacterium CG10_big_fil_rev_8_21_14_0_10_41_12]